MHSQISLYRRMVGSRFDGRLVVVRHPLDTEVLRNEHIIESIGLRPRLAAADVGDRQRTLRAFLKETRMLRRIVHEVVQKGVAKGVGGDWR